MARKIVIRMLSKATSVAGQGVGSAFLEQVALVKEQSDIFDVYVNKLPRGVKADVNHVHTINPSYYLKMRNKKVPSVIYVHFLPETLEGSIKLPKIFFGIFKRYVVKMYKRADAIIVVNPIFIEPLVKLGIRRERISYIPNYVSKAEFHPLSDEERETIRKRYGYKKDDFIVMGCGQLQTRKGVLDFIDVAERNPDVKFLWAGGFSFGSITAGHKEIKKILDHHPANVNFIGLIEREAMNAVYNMADLLFMPSYSELFPMAILEAVNVDKPVLLRDLDLYKDILFSKYLKASDNEGFSEIIRKLRGDSEFYKAAQEDSRYVTEFYSKEHVAQMWRDYYPRVIREFKALGKA